MAKEDNLQDLFKSVADAIRVKGGTTSLINPQDFDTEILNLPSSITKYVTFTAVEAGSTIALNHYGSTGETWVIKYSTNNITWYDYTLGTNIILAAVGDYISFAGIGNFYVSQTLASYHYFTMTGKISCDSTHSCGNLLSQEQGDVLLTTYTFYRLFYGCTALTTAPMLPFTTLMAHCYRSMFEGCTSLKTAPALPASILQTYCYSYMFYGCTSLESPPILQATTLNTFCCSNMFYGCVSLSVTPVLSAISLSTSCYASMFQNCTSITSIPALPATRLVVNCYSYMFDGCNSLYVSDSIQTEASSSWNIPTSGTFTNISSYTQTSMFAGCLGVRSSDNMTGAKGESHTYYTQNTPIS